MGHMIAVLSGAAKSIDISAVLVCIGIGILVGLIAVLVMKGQLKSVRPKNAAADYVVSGSFCLRHSQDIFLYRNVHRTPKPKDKK